MPAIGPGRESRFACFPCAGHPILADETAFPAGALLRASERRSDSRDGAERGIGWLVCNSLANIDTHAISLSRPMPRSERPNGAVIRGMARNEGLGGGCAICPRVSGKRAICTPTVQTRRRNPQMLSPEPADDSPTPPLLSNTRQVHTRRRKELAPRYAPKNSLRSAAYSAAGRRGP